MGQTNFKKGSFNFFLILLTFYVNFSRKIIASETEAAPISRGISYYSQEWVPLTDEAIKTYTHSHPNSYLTSSTFHMDALYMSICLGKT